MNGYPGFDLGLVQPGNESQSSNSVGINTPVQWDLLSPEPEILVETQNESTSNSVPGNTSLSQTKFAGRSQLCGDNDSDNSDIQNFARILRRSTYSCNFESEEEDSWNQVESTKKDLGASQLTEGLALPIQSEKTSRNSEIADVKTNTYNWTAKVLVLEKMPPRQARNSPMKTFQKFILADDGGSRVMGTLFDQNIQLFENKLAPYKCYSITNANVRSIPKQFQIDNIDTQWIISARTVIEEAKENTLELWPSTSPHVAFRDLPNFLDENKDIDLLAIVIKVKEPRLVRFYGNTSTIQEMILINAELMPIMLTLWGPFVNNIFGSSLITNEQTFPIIYCKRLRVISHQTMSLKTKADSSIMINPPTPEARTLKNWLSANINELSEIAVTPDPIKIDPIIAFKSGQKITAVADILPIHKVVWSKVQMSFEQIHQNYTHKASNNCNFGTFAPIGTNFTCNVCQKQSTSQARCKVDVHLTDHTGTITARAFGKTMEEILSLTTKETLQVHNHDISTSIEEAKKKLREEEYIVQIKPQSSRFTNHGVQYNLGCYFNASRIQPQQILSFHDAPLSSGTSKRRLRASNLTSQDFTNKDIEESRAKKQKMELES